MVTKGTWEARLEPEYTCSHVVTQGESLYTKIVCTMINQPEVKANAKLIAAAPDMLHVLKEYAVPFIAKMVADNVQTAMPPENALRIVQSVITKAEGK